jgi:hypothetical protein
MARGDIGSDVVIECLRHALIQHIKQLAAAAISVDWTEG